MLSTYRWNGTLIVVSPTSPRLFKFQFTWTAIAILALSCLISFCVVVAVGYTFPQLITDNDHVRLENENLALRIGNKNAGFAAASVQDRVSRLEQTSRRIAELTEAE